MNITGCRVSICARLISLPFFTAKQRFVFQFEGALVVVPYLFEKFTPPPKVANMFQNQSMF